MRENPSRSAVMWLISILCYQAIEQVYLIKWPVSVDNVTFCRFFFNEAVLQKNNSIHKSDISIYFSFKVLKNASLTYMITFYL